MVHPPRSRYAHRGHRARAGIVAALLGAATFVISAPVGPTSATVETPPPSAPTVTAVSGGDHAVTVSWVPGKTAPGGVALVEYEITTYRSGVSTSKPTFAKPAERTHTVTGLANGASYTFTVGAVWNDGSRSTSSQTVAAVPPFATAARFVDRQFNDFLDRAPAVDEQQDVIDALNFGATSSSLIFALRRHADMPTMVDPVARLYYASFLRSPEPVGLDFWVRRRRAGTATLLKVASSFAASSEFANRYGATTNRQFVELVYQNVLGRPGDKDGVDYWTRQLDASRSRGSVMLGFSESKEFVRKSLPRVDVSLLYIGILGIRPPADELATWTPLLASGDRTISELAAALLDDPRYVV